MSDFRRDIPHSPPFLLIKRIVELTDMKVVARARANPDDELFSRVFAGHFPGNPIVPGALLCEMVFQAGAVLLSRRAGAGAAGIPVLVRISDARFRQMVRPGDELDVEAEYVDRVSNAFYMKGSASVGGKMAVRVEFTCALVPRSEAP